MTARPVLTALLAPCVASSLLAGILGGLLRVGVAVPLAWSGGWVDRGALAHAALMMCGFLGTVICVERAVAAKRRLAWLPPLASAAAAAALLFGLDGLARAMLPLAAASFVAVNVLLWTRQPAGHTGVLVASAAAWLVGNSLYAFGATSGAVLPWWFGFLVLTIAAERLEMTRLMRRRPGAVASLFGVLLVLAVGAALSGVAPGPGGALYGAALMALAGWLLAFDIARRTIRADGLSRYMAVCLLTGYAWLAVGGLAWAATALGFPGRDAALHALGLGFIFSMIMGHAPVILPAIVRVKILFGPWFYLPLALLHGSLLWRLAPGLADVPARAQGATFNAITVALFAATVAGSALAWRCRHGTRSSASRPNLP